MKLYRKECKKIAASILYAWANGTAPADIGFERPLLAKPSEEDDYFGSKVSEEDPEAIMTGVTRALLAEYEDNSYAAYPLGYYKAITLSDDKQRQVLEILCEITGLTEKELNAKMREIYKELGCEDVSFDPITAYGHGAACVTRIYVKIYADPFF